MGVAAAVVVTLVVAAADVMAVEAVAPAVPPMVAKAYPSLEITSRLS